MKTLLTLALISLGFAAFAQKKPVILRTNVKTFKMTDSSDPRSRRSWTVAPELKPDICHTVGDRVVFITDLDSLVVKVSEKKPVFDFIIIYNNTDTCYTRVQFYVTPDYLGKLKKAKKYNSSESRSIPEFTYQDMNNPDLVALRKKYNLDSIAGHASEMNQMLNLMHWIHNLVPHDGQHGNPMSKNADSLIQACSDGSRGLNCRGLAITLNECYLAMGFRSRYITCMPKELEFDDCHVINMVYSDYLQKWIYLDPTNDAYIMDETGMLLSIEEVRDRLINGKPLVLNADANWNNRESVFAEYYIYSYMAKNLYRMECPLSSEYDFETKRLNKTTDYVELLPLDGINQSPLKTQSKNMEFNSFMTNYITNNPSTFWKAPPARVQE